MDRIGRYKIIRELGRGAMGVVYHAIDPNIGRPVAIKTINLGAVLKPDEQERMRERLFREARSAGILSHPGIVTIYDVEQEDDLAYIAMEFVDGVTLDQILSEPQPATPQRIFSVLGQTSAALDYAHGKGIVHRDIKPANVMVAGDGTAKITDFGIAKITASEQFTMTGSIVGTPHYMSPEQVQGQAIDGRSDQFSLAVIAFEMLTGEKPYTGEHLTTVVYKIVAEDPPVPHLINPSLTGPIEVVLRKGLAKKPDGRYSTCSEFVEALERACAASPGWEAMARGGSLNAPTIVQEPGRPIAAAAALPPSRRSQRYATATHAGERGHRKSRFLPFLLAVLMAGGLLAIIGWEAKPWQYFGHSGEPKQDTAAAPEDPGAKKAEPEAPKPAPPPVAAPPASPSPAAASPSSSEPPAVGVAIGRERKPSAMPSAAEKTAPPGKRSVAEAVTRPPAPRPNAPQKVDVISSPGGALAIMDGNADTECTTPCSFDARPGQHAIQFSKTGYEVERRLVEVGSGPTELPAVILRAAQGTLMLSSDPPGGSIQINGKPSPQSTPARINLPPGSYAVTVTWKDGKSVTRNIDIRNGINYQKFIVGQ
jgi:predicted Ser/Thr protein kinase